MDILKQNPDEDPRVAVLRVDTMNLMGTVSDIKIFDQDSYDYANEILKDIIKKRKSVDEILGPRKDLAYKVHKSISDLINEMKAPFIALEERLKPKLGDYIRDQRILKEKADEDARKLEEEKRLAHAQVLADHKMYDEADIVLDQPIKVKSEVKKVDKGGTYTVDIWSAEVVSLYNFLKAALDGVIDLSYVVPNYQKLNETARHRKEDFNIPGVRAIKNTSTRSRI